MKARGGLFQIGDESLIWQKYCGFLQLTLEEFQKIQGFLLRDELKLLSRSPLGKRWLRGKVPDTISEFRSLLPLTTYADYAPYLLGKREELLPQKPCFWAYTTTSGNAARWVPYTERSYENLLDQVMAAFLLAAAGGWGEVKLMEGDIGIYNLAPRPFLSGYLAFGMAERFGFKSLPPLETAETMDFQQRVEEGFRLALHSRVEILCSLSSVLVKMGEHFASGRPSSSRFSLSMLNPTFLSRLVRAYLMSKKEQRTILPKDLWRVKALVGWGLDTSLYKEQIIHYWGKAPYEFHACTEAGILALQGWNKKGMTPSPYSAFLEFLTEEEAARAKDDRFYNPKTLLLGELEIGKRYEVVLTSFYGMPFLRYRVGHLIKVLEASDPETGVQLPQIAFMGRADEAIDLAGFTRLDEKTLWQAIANSVPDCEGWTIRKEFAQGKPVLHFYIELKRGGGESQQAEPLESALHQSLKSLDSSYADLENMLGIRPLQVTILPPGSSQQLYEKKKAQGMGDWRVPHLNPPDTLLQALLCQNPRSLTRS